MPDARPQIRMLYDGLCPLCSREVAFLRRRNQDNAVVFEDIADPSFDPSKYGLTMQQVMGAMHAIKSDGTILSGVDVFIEVYRHCHLTLLSRLIAIKPIRPLLDLGYRIFARLRPRFSKFDPSNCSDRCSPTTARD